MSEQPALDKAAWLEQHAAIWGHRSDWPAGTQMSVNVQQGSSVKDERGSFRTLGFVPVQDAEAA
jgi:hypothetical protein